MSDFERRQVMWQVVVVLTVVFDVHPRPLHKFKAGLVQFGKIYKVGIFAILGKRI